MPKRSVTRKRVPAQVKAFLSAYEPNVQAIALEARTLVLDLVPQAIEQIDIPAKMLAYGFAATYKATICVITPQKSYVNFGLPRGAELPDPAKLLTGTGKRARHVKLTDANKVDTPELRALITASAAQITSSPDT